MKPHFFATPEEFRAWLVRPHQRAWEFFPGATARLPADGYLLGHERKAGRDARARRFARLIDDSAHERRTTLI